jgi:hypothetical protein
MDPYVVMFVVVAWGIILTITVIGYLHDISKLQRDNRRRIVRLENKVNKTESPPI